MPIDMLLYIIAFVLFVVAGAPINTQGWRLEWVAAAVLVLTLIV